MAKDQSTVPPQTPPVPDEDGTVLIYGFLQIKDAKTGQVLVSTRS
jgi:hypothetical protein